MRFFHTSNGFHLLVTYTGVRANNQQRGHPFICMGGLVTCAQATIRTSFVFQTTTCTYMYLQVHTQKFILILLSAHFIQKNTLIYVQCLLNLKSVVESYLNSFYLLLSYRSENRQSLGELFLGFFKYYAVDFRYGFCVQHVTCMRYANGQ